ncbi:MAG: protein translocase subunit SecD [Bdellovibrionota bacterium]
MKIWVILLSAVLSVFFLLPSFLPKDSKLQAYLPNTALNLGLDLRGGIHVVLGVDIRKALDVEIDQLGDRLDSDLKRDEILGASVKRAPGERALLVNLRDAPQSKDLQRILKDNFYQVLMLSGCESETQALVRLDPTHSENIARMSLEQAREIIRNRVDEFGVAEPIIQIEGDDRILVQLPGIEDPQRAIDLIGKTALLEYKVVDETLGVQELSELVEGVRAEVGFTNNFNQDQLNRLNAALRSKLPADTEISFEKESLGRDQVNIQPYLLRAKTVLTGQALEDARVTTDATSQRPQVSLRFSRPGAESFEQITGENVGSRLAILLDGIVISAPVIREKIPAISQGATISLGLGDRQSVFNEARDLALILRSGALPAPVEILENRTVGASLGQDSIDKGSFAGIVAAIFVLLFMLIYYRMGGVVADLMVMMNIAMLLAIMGFFQATLTLPGIAGIVLTVGMAVDANVIIFERIREELRSGKKVRAAVDAGFEAAHKAILDANLTTVIAGIVLFNFGSGPIRGFAITLLIGIICSYITAFWFSRWIYGWYLDKRAVERLAI